MNTSTALMLTVFLSPVISLAIWLLLARPLQSNLDSSSNEYEDAQFWTVYAAIMLFIVPLLAGLVIGVSSISQTGVYPATGMTRILASVLAGSFAALVGIGTQLAKHNRRMTRERMLSRHNVRGEF